MARSALLLALVSTALAAPAGAGGKEFVSLVVVGARGDSVTLRPGAGVIDGFFDHGSRPRLRAQPHGAYVKLYPLGPGDLPGIPGRFFPRTRALCFAWPNWDLPVRCVLATGRQLDLLGVWRGLQLFRGPRTALSSLSRTGLAVDNVAVAIELAIERWRLARSSLRPARCVRFFARWRGPQASHRPQRFCLAPRGVYADGLIYPLGFGVWRLVVANGW